MDDLISRQAAINGKISIQRANEVEIYSDEAVPVGYLKALPPVQIEPQWILCSEKQPEKYGWYICSIKGGNVNTLYYTGKTWIDNVRKNMFELYNITSKLTGEKISPEKSSVYWDGWVIAWMPLPEPYAEQT